MMLLTDLTPLWISFKTASTATLLAFLFGIAAARWMLGYRGPAKGFIDGILTLPLVLPPTVVGFLLLLLLGKNGPVGQVLAHWGISVLFSWGAIVIAATVVAFPLMYKTVLGAFKQVDPTLVSVARTLGASEWQIFGQLLLPLAWPGVMAGTVLAFARALGEFGATLMVGGSIPRSTQTIPIAIFFAAEAGRMEVALMWVLLMVAVSLTVIAGINYGNPPSQGSIWVGKLLKHCFDWLYFGAVDRDRSPMLPLPKMVLSPKGTRSIKLRVDIEKQVPTFRLKVQFSASQAPLGLLGASGSGKSLTLRCIAGLETPNHGSVVLNDRVLFDSKRGINLPSCDRKVGFVFQNYALFPHLTVAQNIAFGMTATPKGQRAAAVKAYLDRAQLGGLGDRYPHQLSGGQQQRVALARALGMQPDILLLDEPLAALDSHLRSQIEKLLIEVLGNYPGITLFITHKLEEAYRVCPNLLVLSNGQILAQDTKQKIFSHPPTYEVARVTGCQNFSRARRVNAHTVQALDWSCHLEVAESMPTNNRNNLFYLCIRSHHIQVLEQQPSSSLEGCNIFPGWLALCSETQHQATLYIKLHGPSTSSQDYHLQAEISQKRWSQLKEKPLPWLVKFCPLHLKLMPH